MAGYRTAAVTGLTSIIILLFFFGFVDKAKSQEEPADSAKADTSRSTPADTKKPAIPKYAIEDSSFIGPIDESLIKPKVELSEPGEFVPYYKSDIAYKSLGDILRYRTGIYVLQHGSIGQPEMIVKSEMLPGKQAVYNGDPVFNQGSYFPFRSGLDMNVLPSDNLSSICITPLSYLGAFTQGEMISLQSSIWPPPENPSSVTIAQGPFDYKQSAWRFSRRFSETIGAAFTAGFKSSQGYYSSGSDYDAFKIAGSFAWRPRPNWQVAYNFYQHKAKEGLVQFDRAIVPTLRSHNDLSFHTVKSIYKYSEKLKFKIDLFRQQIYNRLFDNDISLDFLVTDYIYGAVASADYISGLHNIEVDVGGKRHHVYSIDSDPVLRTGSLLVGDSLAISESDLLTVKGRIRYDRLSDSRVSGTIAYGRKITAKSNLNLSGGAIDYEPDIYAMYYTHPLIEPIFSDLVKSYQYISNHSLESKEIYFGTGSFKLEHSHWLSSAVGLSIEKVTNDLVPVVSESDSVWVSTESNIDYKRLTGTFELGYTLTKYYKGKSGITYFYYDPKQLLPEIKYSPSLLAFTYGEIMIPGVLRDIDLFGAYQMRYYSKRYYEGILSRLIDQYQYDPAFVIDGSLGIRFGSFEFEIVENNILDFLNGNSYSLWGDYSMPPGMVWWTFTWNFKN